MHIVKSSSTNSGSDDGKSAIINFDIARRKSGNKNEEKEKNPVNAKNKIYKFRPNQTANDKLISYFIKLHDVCA